MADRLAKIIATKREQLAEQQTKVGIEDLKHRCEQMPKPSDFAAALAEASGTLAVIAEAKRRSPSAGLIVAEYDPAARAHIYEKAGAACLSVLTDETFFGGSAADLQAARAACSLPVLRKDFIFSEYQVYETRAMGADCMLLIAGVVSDEQLLELAQLGMQLGLAVVVEIHEPVHVSAAIACKTGLIGVNNRNLRTFETDLAAMQQLVPQLASADCIVIAESAIRTEQDAALAAAAGAHAVLVGEALMSAEDPAELVARIANPPSAL